MTKKSTAPVLLIYLNSYPESCIKEISNNTGIKVKTARIMLTKLLKSGYIEKDKDERGIAGERLNGTKYRQLRILNTYRIRNEQHIDANNNVLTCESKFDRI